MKKIMVGLVLLGALAWVWLFGFHSDAASTSFISYTYLSSGVQDSTVVISGKPAGNISVYNAGANLATVSWNNNGANAGSVPAGASMTWNGVEVYQYTITSASATEVYAWTW